MKKPQDIKELEQALGHRFRHRELLEQALTHSSLARETEARQAGNGEPARVADNEQMEFLGDAVLGFVTSQALFEGYPQFREGQLSKLRAYLVSAKHLFRTAHKLKLGRYLRLGRGEEKSGGRKKATLQVDAFEALLAAVFLDVGLDKTRRLILSLVVQPELKRLKRQLTQGLPITDYKSALQEALHTAARPQPAYVLVKEEGPEHSKTFTVEARVFPRGGHSGPEYVGQGAGSTKKNAEQDAAKQALELLQAAGEQARPSPSAGEATARKPKTDSPRAKGTAAKSAKGAVSKGPKARAARSKAHIETQ
jgi:ribonuclease-3